MPGVRKSGIPALQETPAPVSTTILLYFLDDSMLATVWMDCGAFLMGGAIETLPKVAVRASILTSSFSLPTVVVGDEVDALSSLAVLLLLSA